MTTGTGSLREAQKALTRSRIIDAARTVFEAQGYSRTSIGLVTTEADINRATFYLHFPHKAAVFREVVALDRMGTDAYWRRLNEALLEGTRDALTAWVRSMARWADDNASLMAARHEAMASDPDFARELQPRFDRLFAELAPYLATVPADHHVEVKARLQVLIAMLDQMFLQAWVQGAWTTDKDLLLATAADIWCSALDVT